MEKFIDIAYLLSAISFIYGLKMLSHPRTARNGNLIASLGMLIAIVTTVYLGTDLDLSQAFTCIEITGEDIPLFLNRHLPVDLRENVFVFPASASSAIHHVSVKLLKFSIDKYYLFIPRGFALSIWEILLETSKQFGYEILDR